MASTRDVDNVQMWVQRLGGAAVIVFGLVLLGAVNGPVFREFYAISEVPRRLGKFRPIVLGVAFGAAWTPCVGPLLGAALVVASQSGGGVRGAALLGAYGLGVGAPFLGASLALASLPTWNTRLRKVSKWVHPGSGVLMVTLGLLLASGMYGMAV